ncbi:hexose kinase [Enterococcus caccae]|uniref:Tagatose-6-phosphate kinase n=1 Tax=Enterococcus caccae ATCC BAA-1240 TaxID=1158612 RepID=R3WP33_9ENTE|nr:hexose kinase [Enterococcus caccae]EOL43595.1 tagatose-6-phosphate kinase [Enterococcus caccae ATCC BAA-1240]EOT68005.1 tagatose-6-phosphate kinase [Enterococcus caccae ATCC BAA-1240]
MILTVTMNPSVDMAYQMDTFQLDEVNRVTQVVKTAGGKGLNVTRVLQQLGVEVKATGIVGGHFGEFIKAELAKQTIDYQFYEINQESRNSIALLHDGLQTEILEAGPTILKNQQMEFLEVYKQLLKTATTVTLSGSLSKGLPSTFYSQLILLAQAVGCAVLLDTSGNSLKEAVHAKVKPMLIKPNETEIAELLGVAKVEKSVVSLKKQLQEPLFSEIPWVVVSMGASGAFAKFQDRFFEVTIPKIDVVNPVGSGDATLAGIAAMIDQAGTPEEVLKMGMTTGMLNAMETSTGQINPNLVQRYYEQVQVIEK